MQISCNKETAYVGEPVTCSLELRRRSASHACKQKFIDLAPSRSVRVLNFTADSAQPKPSSTSSYAITFTFTSTKIPVERDALYIYAVTPSTRQWLGRVQVKVSSAQLDNDTIAALFYSQRFTEVVLSADLLLRAYPTSRPLSNMNMPALMQCRSSD